MVWEVFFFILGSCVGSFLNCVIYRIPKGESFLKGRSSCPFCKKPLAAKDLVPIFSFLLLKGKCRFCHQKISLQYPLVEFFTGLVFLATFSKFSQNLPLLLFFLFIFSFFVLIFVFDLKYLSVPDPLLFLPILAAFFYKIKSFSFENLFSFFAPFFLAAFLLFFILVSKEKWFGWGDFWFSVLMGEILTFEQVILATLFAFWVGALVSLFLVLLKKKTFKSQIPFCPFLILGTFFAIFVNIPHISLIFY